MLFSDKNKMTAIVTAGIFFIFFDRLLKFWAISHPGKTVPLFSDLFQLSLAKNYYIAFSLPFSGPLLNAVILIIIAILLYLVLILAKKGEYLQVGLLTNILFGAISNVYDRFHYGFVIDYFDLKYFTIFNVADSMIVVGAVILSIFIYKKGV